MSDAVRFTPGPRGTTIGTITVSGTVLDAQLIAAAPDLYAALKELTWLSEFDPSQRTRDARVNARAALAKARGES